MTARTRYSPLMNLSIDKFMNLPQQYYDLHVYLSLTNQPAVSAMKLENVTDITVDQNFVENYTDKVTLTFDATAELYMTVLKNYKDLEISITMYPVLHDATDHLPNSSYTGTFKALVVGKEDLEKVYAQGVLQDNTEVGLSEAHLSQTKPMTLELVPDKVYIARKRAFCTVMTDATVEDALYYMAATLNYSKVFIVKPDNTTVYKNLIIPPLLKITNAVSYLQDQMGLGVYYKGINCYINNDVFYVFPNEYDNPSTIKTVNIYLPGNDAFPNLGRYHYLDRVTSDVHILAGAGKITNTDYSDSHMENVGNTIVMHRSASILDTLVSVTGTDVTIANTWATSAKYNTQAGVRSNANHISFAYDGNNPYTHTSRVAKDHRVVHQIPWSGSVPFGIHPGSKVAMYYDTLNGFAVKMGLMHRVFTKIIPMGNRSVQRRYASNSVLVVSSSPDAPMVISDVKPIV